MNFLLIAAGSHGDIHPFIALARALRARGHRAGIVTNGYFRGIIEAAGEECLESGMHADLGEMIRGTPAMHPVLGPLYVMRTLAMKHARDTFLATQRWLRERACDAVLTHPICLGASWAAEQARVASVPIVLSPCVWFNPSDTLVMSGWSRPEPSPRAIRVQVAIGRWVMRGMIDGPGNRLRRELGLPKLRGIFLRECSVGPLVLGLWSPALRPPLPGDPDHSHICGFAWHDAAFEETEELCELDRFLNDGESPVVFTLGTAGVHSPGTFYAQAARACTLAGRRGVLLVGRKEYLPRELPRGVRAFSYVPYSRLFARASVIVHHGGIGTCAQVLRSGRPSIVSPMSHDQFDNAARLHRLGCAEIVRHGAASPERFARAIRQIDAGGHTERAVALSAAVGGEDGAARAAELLERRFLAAR